MCGCACTCAVCCVSGVCVNGLLVSSSVEKQFKDRSEKVFLETRPLRKITLQPNQILENKQKYVRKPNRLYRVAYKLNVAVND